MKVESVNWFQYLIKFRDYREPLLDKYITVNADNVIILGCFDETGASKGMLVCNEGDVIDVVCMKACNDDYHVKWQLIDSLKKHADIHKKNLYISCTNEHADVLKDYGFMLERRYYYFTGIYNDAVEQTFKRLKEKLVPNWERRGFSIRSFSELTAQEYDTIIENKEKEFDDSLKVKDVLEDSEYVFEPTLSFAVFYDNRICAYNMMGKNSYGVIRYRIRQTSKQFPNLGLSIYCTIATIDKMGESGHTKLEGIVYSDNKSAMPLISRKVNHLLNTLDEFSVYSYIHENE